MAENENQSFWKRNWDWVSDGFAGAAKDAGKTFIQVSEGTGQLITGTLTDDPAQKRAAANKLEPGLRDAQEKAFKTTEFITLGLAPVRPTAKAGEGFVANNVVGVPDKSGGAHTGKEFAGQWINSSIINSGDIWLKLTGKRASDLVDLTKAHKMELVKQHIDVMLGSYPEGKVTVEQFNQAFRKYVDENMKHGDIIALPDGTVLAPEEFLKKTRVEGVTAEALAAWGKSQKTSATSLALMQEYRDKHPDRNIVLVDKQGFIARDEAVELGAKAPEKDNTNLWMMIGGGVLTALGAMTSWLIAIPGILLLGYSAFQYANEGKPNTVKAPDVTAPKPSVTPNQVNPAAGAAQGRGSLGNLNPSPAPTDTASREVGGR